MRGVATNRVRAWHPDAGWVSVGLYRRARFIVHAQIRENLRGAVGVVDGIEGGVADEFPFDDGHGKALEIDAREFPLLREAMGETGFVVAFQTADDGVIGFVHAGGLGGANLRWPGNGRDIKDAVARLVGKALRVDVLKVGARLSQERKLGGRSSGLVLGLTGPNMNAIPFETHDSTSFSRRVIQGRETHHLFVVFPLRSIVVRALPMCLHFIGDLIVTYVPEPVRTRLTCGDA